MKLLIALALAAAPSALALAPYVPDDEPTCYEWTKTSKGVTWDECATECEALGGFLPCIEDASQNAEAFAAFGGSGHGAWINVHDTASEGEWVCGTQTQTYLPWDPFAGEPNGGTRENCVNMWGPVPPPGGRTSEKWNDMECGFSGFPTWAPYPCLCKTPTPCDA